MRTTKKISRNIIVKTVICAALAFAMVLPSAAAGRLDLTTVTAQAASASISNKSLKLVEGKSQRISVSGSTSAASWTSSNNSVASVSQSGKVTAKHEGSATITAAVGSAKLRCKVKVIVDPNIDAKAKAIMDKMSLTDKIYQMFIVTPEGLTGVNGVTAAGRTTQRAIRNHPVGGICYFSNNLVSVSQTQQMIANTQKYSEKYTGLPMFISVDEEGGNVARCAQKLGTTKLSPMYYYQNKGRKRAYKNAQAIAAGIAALGFNLDYAPVADVWSNSQNTVIGTRAYSTSFSKATALIPYAVRGFHSRDMLCTLKHFPGHGNTAGDSHTGSVYNNKSLSYLNTHEFLSFKAGIDAGADFVMVGHITDTKIDSAPASLSYKFVTKILKKKLGFNGLVITDSLSMGGVTNSYSTAQIAVKAVQAGDDILLTPTDLTASVNAIRSAVNSGTISESRIDRSVRKIIIQKLKIVQ